MLLTNSSLVWNATEYKLRMIRTKPDRSDKSKAIQYYIDTYDKHLGQLPTRMAQHQARVII